MSEEFEKTRVVRAELDDGGWVTVGFGVEERELDGTTVNEERRDVFFRGVLAELFEGDIAREGSRIEFGRRWKGVGGWGGWVDRL
jgi:hypothetical protein